MRKYIAECIGTMVLTLLGCGTAMFLGCNTAAGVVGTAVAFGLSVVAMAYTIGGISGCHINPARSIGPALFAGGQALKDLWVFIVAPSAAEPSAPSYGQHSRQQLTRSSFSTCHPKP